MSSGNKSARSLATNDMITGKKSIFLVPPVHVMWDCWTGGGGLTESWCSLCDLDLKIIYSQFLSNFELLLCSNCLFYLKIKVMYHIKHYLTLLRTSGKKILQTYTTHSHSLNFHSCVLQNSVSVCLLL